MRPVFYLRAVGSPIFDKERDIGAPVNAQVARHAVK
jgi:hypothetical protein